MSRASTWIILIFFPLLPCFASFTSSSTASSSSSSDSAPHSLCVFPTTPQSLSVLFPSGAQTRCSQELTAPLRVTACPRKGGEGTGARAAQNALQESFPVLFILFFRLLFAVHGEKWPPRLGGIEKFGPHFCFLSSH